jgi:hypothetical protein
VGTANKFGYIDTTGKLVVPLQYDQAWDFINGYASVVKDGKTGYIDATGQEIIPPQFESAWPFSEEGLAPVYLEGKWGFIDATGEFVIEPQFMDISFPGHDNPGLTFASGLAPVAVEGPQGPQYGYIDKTGQFAIEPQYTWAEPFKNGLARVDQGSSYGYINPQGEMVWGPIENAFRPIDGPMGP